METEGQPEEGQQEPVAPVENAAPESSEQPVKAEESGTPETPKSEGEPEQPKKPRFQERISELVRDRNEARQQAALMAQMLEKFQQPQQPQKAEGKPDPSKFESWDAYTEALTDWKLDQYKAQQRAEREQLTAQEHQVKATQSFKAREVEALEKYEDYEEVTRSQNLPVTQAMAQAILESDMGPDVWYYLGNNAKEAARIAQLSPASQIREIGKIEAKLSATPVTPKVPTASPPIKPVNTGKAVNDSVPSDQDDIKTWVKKRNKQLGRS